MTRIEQICETSNFIDDCLKKHDFQENHVALFLADFNVDAVGEKHPSDYVKSFTRPEVLFTFFFKLYFFHKDFGFRWRLL